MSYFDEIQPVAFKGPDSTDPFSFRFYEADRQVMGKTMAEHLRWAICYWHSFHWPGSDVFGEGTFERPWNPGQALSRDGAIMKLDAAFAFFGKMQAPFYCFHDVDAMADHDDPETYVEELAFIVDAMEARIGATGVGLLWGTANLFGHRRYAAGGATNPDPEVFAYAALQVRSMLEATHRLKGANYVLWGGREGYDTILNTDIAREMDQLGRFMSMVVEHKHRIGFDGTILIEPKPHEPTKHQYDRDSATIFGFLQKYGLEDEVAVNIEGNHATLAGHSFEHEIATANALGIFGSIDMNRGDPQNGWDTDQFPNNAAELTLTLYHLLKGGGFTTGGFNFDAKVRRQSMDAEDLFHAHIGGVDVLARALLNAAALIEDGSLDRFVTDRYAGWNTDRGARIMGGTVSLAELADEVLDRNHSPQPVSGRQEYLENLVNRFNR